MRQGACVIDRESASQAVENRLERDFQQWQAAGVAARRMAVADVEEHEVWIISRFSEEFVRIRDPKFMSAGNGPQLVDRVDGGLHRISVVCAVAGEWEADYRARKRPLPAHISRRSSRCATRSRYLARMHAPCARGCPRSHLRSPLST